MILKGCLREGAQRDDGGEGKHYNLTLTSSKKAYCVVVCL